MSKMSRRSRKPSLKVKENLEAEAELQLQEVEADKAKLSFGKGEGASDEVFWAGCIVLQKK